MDELDDARAATRRWRRATVWTAAVVAVLAVIYGFVRPSGEPSKVGRVAPDFELERLIGSGSISSSDLKGDPVIINFWASWCDPCREEAPLFEKAWREHRDDGLMVLGVDLRDAPGNARAFAEEEGITYPLVVDPDEVLAKDLGVTGLPQTFFVDSEWRLQAVGQGDEVGSESGIVVLGAVSEELLAEQIDRLLDDRP